MDISHSNVFFYDVGLGCQYWNIIFHIEDIHIMICNIVLIINSIIHIMFLLAVVVALLPITLIYFGALYKVLMLLTFTFYSNPILS